MKTALFVAILLIAISVPAAYASTLQLVTENGNVFSIDFDEILNTWELYHGNSTARTALNGTVLQEIDNLQTQIDDLIAKLNSNSTETEIDRLEERVDDLLTQLNSNSTSTETEIERLGDLIANLTSNSDVAIDRLEQLIANLDNATESEITELNELLDELETELESQIDELEAGTGVGAGALGSSGRLVAIPPSGILVYGDHTVRDTRGIINSTIAYLFPGNGFEWATLIRNYDAYDEYEVPVLGMEYTANHGTLTGTPAPSTVELDVDGLPPLTAWALYPNGTDTAVYAGVTNSAGEVLIPRTPNDGVTITRTTSFDSSPDLHIIDRGAVYDTITVSEHGIVNDLHVTITSSSSYYRAQLISPDGTNYQVNTSGASGSKTYAVDASGEQINGDWTLIYKSTSGTRTLQDWTLAINHGSTGKVQSISGSGSQYTVSVEQARSGLFGLDLVNAHGIVDSYNNLLDNSLQTGPDEIHDAGGGGNLCNDGGFYVCSIERSNPATEQVSTSSVEYLVTFNEDAINVDASDFVSLRSIVTVSPKVQNTAFDVWHDTEQALPSTSRISVNGINTITSAKLILDASSPNSQFVNEWKLNLTAQDGTNMIITDGSSTRLESAGGSHEFYLGEMIGLNPSNGYWTLSVIDNSYDDDPIASGTDDPEGQINSWSLEFEHASTTSSLGTIGTVRQDGTNNDKYIVPVTGLYNNYNGYTLWLKGDNDIEQTSGGNMIDPREEFAPDPHESYNRGSVSIPSTPHVRGITVSSSTFSSVTFQVTFSETVTGVNATDFIVIENGSPESSGPQESTYSSAPNISINSGTITTVSNTIPISGYADGVVDVLTLDVDISHTRTGDLEVELVGPDGTIRMIHNNVGGTTADLVTSFTPDFAGKSVNGNWTLQVRDNGTTQSYGTINSWSLDFSYEDTPTWEELLDVEAGKGDLYTWKPVLSGSHDLRIYPDALVHTETCTTGSILIDAHNLHTTCIPNNVDRDFIYTSFTYMRYPVTVDVDISNIQMSRPGRSSADLGYIDGSFVAGDIFFIPIVPGMSTLNIQINGVDAVVHLADVAEPVQILPISVARGNPVSSNVAMFITSDGNVTAQVQVSTDRGSNVVVYSDFRARYAQLKTSCNDFATVPGNCTLRDKANAAIQSSIKGQLDNNWGDNVYTYPQIRSGTFGVVERVTQGYASSMISSPSRTAFVTFDVYRNGILIVSESDSKRFTPSSTNTYGAGHVPWVVDGFVPIMYTALRYDDARFDITNDLSFYAETGDYVEIYITSWTRSYGGESLLSTPSDTASVCTTMRNNNSHTGFRSTWDSTFCARIGPDGNTEPGHGHHSGQGIPTLGPLGVMFRDHAPPATFSNNDHTNEITGGYVLLQSGG